MAAHPQTPLYEKAIALHRAGKVGEAIQVYFMVLETEPLNVEAFYRTGLALCEAGGYEDGASILAHAVKLDGTQARYHRLLGVARGRAGQFEGALASIDQAIALAPDKASFHADKADILVSAGQSEAAITCYDHALALNPGSVEDWLNRGATLIELGRHQEAAESFDRVLALDPNYTLAHFNRGQMLLLLDQPKEALDSLRRGLARDPDNVDALNNAALALLHLGHTDDALTFTTQALKLDPAHARVLVNRARILLAQGKPADAVTVADHALATHPDLGEAHMLLGIALQAQGRKPDEPADAPARAENAIAHFEKAAALLPQSADAQMNLGIALYDLQRHDDAAAAHTKALALAPDHAHAYVNMANALHQLRRYRNALTHYDGALALEPAMREAAQVHLHRANAFSALDEPDAAEAALNAALKIDPDFVQAKWDKALLYLGQGRLKDGWPLHGYRFAANKAAVPRPYTQKRWRGESVDGTLLTWAEQGLGEHILHASLTPDLLQRAQTLVIEVEPRLVDLFARSFPQAKVVALGKDLYKGTIDAQISLADAGSYLRGSFDDFPKRDTGYLTADPARVRALRERLAGDGRKVVGLSWVSKNVYLGESKSTQLEAFAPLLRLPGIRFVDLQYGDTSAERDAVARKLGITVERLPDIDNTNDIDGLAALVTACDAVVSISNTTAHLAGALGRPTWVFLPFGHARLWYWFNGRTRSPWYPHVHVHKQHDGERWTDAIGAAVPEIGAFLQR